MIGVIILAILWKLVKKINIGNTKEVCLHDGQNGIFCMKCGAKLLQENNKKYKVPKEIFCSNCGKELELDEKERIKGEFVCPNCNYIHREDA